MLLIIRYLHLNIRIFKQCNRYFILPPGRFSLEPNNNIGCILGINIFLVIYRTPTSLLSVPSGHGSPPKKPRKLQPKGPRHQRPGRADPGVPATWLQGLVRDLVPSSYLTLVTCCWSSFAKHGGLFAVGTSTIKSIPYSWFKMVIFHGIYLTIIGKESNHLMWILWIIHCKVAPQCCWNVAKMV